MTGVHDSSATPWPFEDLVDRYELAYRASEDALRDQRDRIDEMRGRAITLLSVAVGVLAFLGERLFDNGASRRLDTGWGPFNSHAAVAVSVVSFLVVVGSAVWVWWPVTGSFTLSGKQIIIEYIETTPTVGKGEMLRDLALWNSIHVEANRSTLLQRQRAVAWAMVRPRVAACDASSRCLGPRAMNQPKQPTPPPPTPSRPDPGTFDERGQPPSPPPRPPS